MEPTADKRCGSCIKFHTPKCVWQYGMIPKDEPKLVDSFEEFLKELYTIDSKPVLMDQVYYPIYAADVACADFEE